MAINYNSRSFYQPSMTRRLADSFEAHKHTQDKLKSVEEQLASALEEKDRWKAISIRFADCCEIDGFGDVRSAHMGNLTKTYGEFEEFLNVR